jgi:hypothetical protein
MSPASIPTKPKWADMESVQKLALEESHRRIVSAVLRRVEATCDEVLDWLIRPGANLQRFSEDISAAQADELRAHVGRLRQEILRFQNEIMVDPLVQSRSRGIASAISHTRVEIEEVLTPGLRGYGVLSQEVETALDEKFARLLAHLYAMSGVVDHGDSRRAL